MCALSQGLRTNVSAGIVEVAVAVATGVVNVVGKQKEQKFACNGLDRIPAESRPNVQSPSEKPSNLACQCTLAGNAPQNHDCLSRCPGLCPCYCTRKIKCLFSQEAKPRGALLCPTSGVLASFQTNDGLYNSASVCGNLQWPPSTSSPRSTRSS